MSQLDVSISFSNLIGLLFCFFVFIYFVVVITVQYWYNNKLRNLSSGELSKELIKIDNSVIIKRILKL